MLQKPGPFVDAQVVKPFGSGRQYIQAHGAELDMAAVLSVGNQDTTTARMV
jgi:hypothetical protein